MKFLDMPTKFTNHITHINISYLNIYCYKNWFEKEYDIVLKAEAGVVTNMMNSFRQLLHRIMFIGIKDKIYEITKK